jgi:hypothetical protein
MAWDYGSLLSNTGKNGPFFLLASFHEWRITGARNMPSLFVPWNSPSKSNQIETAHAWTWRHGGPMMGDRMMYGRPTGLVNHIIHHTSVHASLCVSYSNTEDLNSDVEGFRFPRLSSGRFPVPRPELNPIRRTGPGPPWTDGIRLSTLRPLYSSSIYPSQ